MNNLPLIVCEFAASAHFMMSLVLFVYSRRSVSFLPQAWIMLLFFLMYGGATVYLAFNSDIQPLGMLHPIMLMYLTASSFLQTVQPLGLCLPGYLQWQRMWKYASPAILVILIYGTGYLAGASPVMLNDAGDFGAYLLSGDVLLRCLALFLSAYYIINLFRLPHHLVRKFMLPPFLRAYVMALGCTAVFFVVLTIRFSFPMLLCYILLFTAVNLSLFIRLLRPGIQAIAYPDIKPVTAPPSADAICESERNDFNEANLHRFEVMEYVMQNEKPYTDCQFNRERLCRLAGFNRHLVLQSLRSQGYNDVHEYIARYRVTELKNLIQTGIITNPQKQFERVGFRTYKTTLICFERYEGVSLPEWLQQVAELPAAETEEGRM